jgi:hypothetical protein
MEPKSKRKREAFEAEKEDNPSPSRTAKPSKLAKTDLQKTPGTMSNGDHVSQKAIPATGLEHRSLDILFLEHADDSFERSAVFDKNSVEVKEMQVSVNKSVKRAIDRNADVEKKQTERILDDDADWPDDISTRRKKAPRIESTTQIVGSRSTERCPPTPAAPLKLVDTPNKPNTLQLCNGSNNSNLNTNIQKESRTPIDNGFDNDDDWVSVVRGIDKIDILARNAASHNVPHLDTNSTKVNVSIKLEKELKSFATDSTYSAEDRDGLIFEKPVTVERNLLSNSRVPSGVKSSKSSSFLTESSLRNVKRFVKNMVKSSSEVVSVRFMERVLPKESEREIQV